LRCRVAVCAEVALVGSDGGRFDLRVPCAAGLRSALRSPSSAATAVSSIFACVSLPGCNSSSFDGGRVKIEMDRIAFVDMANRAPEIVRPSR
jgi:hypothetical protein